MPNHPALAANRVAVVTGAASGIGLAASAKFAALGMKVCMADLGGEALEAAAAKVRAAAAQPNYVRSFAVDVSNLDDVRRLKTSVYRRLRRGRRADEQRRNRRGRANCSAIRPAGGASSTSTSGA